MATLNFDANTIEPKQAFSLIPAGFYPVVITGTETLPTKNGAGSYLSVTMEVIDGPHKGRKVFDRLNLDNPNPAAVEIAYKTLSSICHATGVIQVTDSSQLHSIPLEAKVSVKEAKDGYEATNEIKGYRAAQQAAIPQQHASQVSPPATAPVAPPMPSAQPAAQPAWGTPPAPQVSQAAPPAQAAPSTPPWGQPQQ